MIHALTRALDEAHIPFEVLPHSRSESALGEAVALAMPPDCVAKTVVVKTPTGNVRAVVSASDRVDFRELATHLGLARGDLRLATEGELVADYPSFEIGAVPPLGGERPEPVVVEQRLTESEWVVFDAGTHAESVKVATAALLEATGAPVARFRARDDE